MPDRPHGNAAFLRGCWVQYIHGNDALGGTIGTSTNMQVVRAAPKLRVPVGILISSDGPYCAASLSMQRGALQAVEEINTDGELVQIEPVIGNPGGELARYSILGREMLAAGIKHVVGCYTSVSRQEVLPLFEKADALLWYPSHYEGFESAPNVVYTGAVANQHLLPLIDYLLDRIGRTAFCIGSDYIWAWESNRILDEAIGQAGGRVIAEQYFPVGSIDFTEVIESILLRRPSFVFNTLIGISSYHFLRELRAACRARGIDQPATIPIASCTLSEPELQAIGPDACDGHITSSVYFASIDTPENARFKSRYAARYPESPAVSADAEASYNAVRLLAMALTDAGTTEIAAVKRAVARQSLRAPQGLVSIDPETMHGSLTPRIGRSTTDHQFEILVEASLPLRADPYLIGSSSRFGAVTTGSRLRVAS